MRRAGDNVHAMNIAAPARAPDELRSLRRATLLLRLLSMRPATGWRLTDLAQATQLHHTTVHRLLAGLSEARLAMRVPGSVRYTLGPLAYEMGLAVRTQFAPPAPLCERLALLAAQTGGIVFLTMRSADDSVCIGRWDGKRALKAYTVNVGTRRALSLSAGGMAILCAMERKERDAVVRRNLEDIARRSDARVTAVRRMLGRSLRCGYGLNQQDIIPGIVAIGVPFGAGAPVGALSLAGTADDLAPQRCARLAERLQREVRLIPELWPEGRYPGVAATD